MLADLLGWNKKIDEEIKHVIGRRLEKKMNPETKIYFEFPECPHQFGGWCRECLREIVGKEVDAAYENAAKVAEIECKGYAECAEAIRRLKSKG